MRPDDRSRPNFRAGADHSARLDRHVGLKTRFGVDVRGARRAVRGVNRGGTRGGGIEPREHCRHGSVGLRGHQQSAACRRVCDETALNDDGARPCGTESIAIARIVEKRELIPSRRLQRRHGRNFSVGRCAHHELSPGPVRYCGEIRMRKGGKEVEVRQVS